MKQFKSQRGAIDLILIAVVAILAIGLGGYVRYQQVQTQKAEKAAGEGVIVTKHPVKSQTASNSSSATSSSSTASTKVATPAPTAPLLLELDGTSVQYSNWKFKMSTDGSGQLTSGSGKVTNYPAGIFAAAAIKKDLDATALKSSYTDNSCYANSPDEIPNLTLIYKGVTHLHIENYACEYPSSDLMAQVDRAEQILNPAIVAQ